MTMREQRRSLRGSLRDANAEGRPSLRLFYALWPDEQTRARLAALQAGIIGRQVDTANLHLTLAFLGNQSSDLLSTFKNVMQALALTPFTLMINEYGYFSKPRIVWAGPSSPPETLLSLQHSLWQSLIMHGVPLKTLARFRPHITLVREAERTHRQWDADIEWRVEMIALVQSIPVPGGVRYHLLASRQF